MPLSSTTGCKRTTKRNPRCGAPSWVLQQLWIDVSMRCPHAERYNESASKPWVSAVAGEAGKTKRYVTAVRALVFETYGRLGEGTKLLRDLVTTAAANGHCSPHAVGRWRTQLERVLLCCLHKQTHTCERWVPESQSDLLLSLLCFWQSGACIVFVCLEVFAVRLSCEGSSDRDRDRDRQRAHDNTHTKIDKIQDVCQQDHSQLRRTCLVIRGHQS